jgi:spore photoproduct lyase
MFSRIFVEKEVYQTPRVQNILKRFKNVPVQRIDDLELIFNRVKKPYLQKRDQLQLFLGQKKGQLVKETPAAYGLSGEPHYYFIHSYNCIYECQYCYLQGYFNSPDIVLFLNYEDIAEEIIRITNEHTSAGLKRVWFHSGEYSDSLALSHITGELPYLHKIFKELPEATLELRTKSANIKELLELAPLPNFITSFSLSTQRHSKEYDLKTAPLKTRIKIISQLANKGHPIGLHLDPIIYSDTFIEDTNELIDLLFSSVSPDQINYISLGVVRFTKDVYHQVQQNYPESSLLASEFSKSFDQKIRYPKPMRLWMLHKVKSMLIEAGMQEKKIYLCMEEDDDQG